MCFSIRTSPSVTISLERKEPQQDLPLEVLSRINAFMFPNKKLFIASKTIYKSSLLQQTLILLHKSNFNLDKHLNPLFRKQRIFSIYPRYWPPYKAITAGLLAIQSHNVGAVKFLASLRAPRGGRLINFAQILEGVPKKNFAKDLRFLGSCRGIDGELVVDFNAFLPLNPKQHIYSITLLYLAILRKDIEALRILASLKSSSGDLAVNFLTLNRPLVESILPEPEGFFKSIKDKGIQDVLRGVEVCRILFSLRTNDGNFVTRWNPFRFLVEACSKLPYLLNFAPTLLNTFINDDGTTIVDFNSMYLLWVYTRQIQGRLTYLAANPMPIDPALVSPTTLKQNQSLATYSNKEYYTDNLVFLQYLSSLRTSNGDLIIDFNLPCNSLGDHLVHKLSYSINKLMILASIRNQNGDLVVDFNARNRRGETLVHILTHAQNLCYLKILSTLKDREENFILNFNIPDTNGKTPLYIAAERKNIALLLFFASLRTDDGRSLIDFNAADLYGNTLAHKVISAGSLDAVQSLISLKNDEEEPLVDFFTPINHNGKTPIDLAIHLKHKKIIHCIQQNHKRGWHIPNMTSLFCHKK